MRTNEKLSSSEFQMCLIDERKSAICVQYHPLLYKSTHVIHNENTNRLKSISPKLISYSTQYIMHAPDKNKGDDVLDFPCPNDFDLKYPDFKIDQSAFIGSHLISSYLADIKKAATRPPALKVSFPSAKPILALEISDVIVHVLAQSQTSTLPQISINNSQLNLSRLVIRPNSFKFLEVLSEYYNIVLYTANPKNVAKPIIDIIDMEGKIFMEQLYQDSCIKIANGFIAKDLRIFGELSQVIMVDTAVSSYALQPTNGLLVKPFEGNEEDNSLLPLMSFLIEIKGCADMRQQIKKKLNLHEYL